MKTKYTSLIIAGALLATTFAGTIKSRGTAGATQLSVLCFSYTSPSPRD